MENCLISIIIPMFNVQEHIERCVGSILAQNLDFEHEIILINDGSTDESLAKAYSIADGKHHITIISQENKGLGGARNSGIKVAKGEFLLFLDPDDILVDGALPKLLNLSIENDADILEFAARGINLAGKIIYEFSAESHSVQNGKAYYNSIRYMNSACNKLYKTSFLRNNELFFLDRIYIEDFEFNTRVFAKAEIVLATTILGANFTQSQESITRTNAASKLAKMQEDIIKVIEITAKLYKKEGNTAETKMFYEERLGFLTVTLFYQLLKRKAGYHEVEKVRRELIQKGIFFQDFKIHDKGKEFFRKIVLRNMYIYPLIVKFFKEK